MSSAEETTAESTTGHHNSQSISSPSFPQTNNQTRDLELHTPLTTPDCASLRKPVLPGWPWARFLLLVLDNVIAGLIIGPLTVFYFRGTAVLLDQNLLPDVIIGSDGSETVSASRISGWICAVIGNVGLLAAVYCQPVLRRRLKIDRALDWFDGYHVYTYVIAFLRVCRFRGTLVLLTAYTGSEPVATWSCLAVGFFGLCFLRSSCNVLFPPMFVCVDLDPNVLTSATRFATQPKNRELHLLDNLFSLFLMQLMICYWRGAWNTIDIYLYPDDPNKSALVCIAFAAILQAILCIVQPVFNVLYSATPHQITRRRCRTALGDSDDSRANFFRRYLLHTIICVFFNVLCFTHWRGLWILLGNMLASRPASVAAGVQHVVGMVGLWLMLAGNSVSALGLGVDGDEKAETGCLAPNEYLRYFIARGAHRKTSTSMTAVACEQTEPVDELVNISAK